MSGAQSGGLSRMTPARELSPPENGLLYARFCDQTFPFSELARGLSSPANCLALLPRPSFGWLFVGFPALQFTEKAFALELLFQDPQCLIDIIFTNENFQSGFLSRLIKQVGNRTATPVRHCALPSRPHARIFSECRIHGSSLLVAQAWLCPLWAMADVMAVMNLVHLVPIAEVSRYQRRSRLPKWQKVPSR